MGIDWTSGEVVKVTPNSRASNAGITVESYLCQLNGVDIHLDNRDQFREMMVQGSPVRVMFLTKFNEVIIFFDVNNLESEWQ